MIASWRMCLVNAKHTLQNVKAGHLPNVHMSDSRSFRELLLPVVLSKFIVLSKESIEQQYAAIMHPIWCVEFNCTHNLSSSLPSRHRFLKSRSPNARLRDSACGQSPVTPEAPEWSVALIMVQYEPIWYNMVSVGAECANAGMMAGCFLGCKQIKSKQQNLR